jgi:hypothetical protein
MESRIRHKEQQAETIATFMDGGRKSLNRQQRSGDYYGEQRERNEGINYGNLQPNQNEDFMRSD